jgi:hypothetical protein
MDLKIIKFYENLIFKSCQKIFKSIIKLTKTMRSKWKRSRSWLTPPTISEPPVLMAVVVGRAVAVARVNALHKVSGNHRVLVVVFEPRSSWLTSIDLLESQSHLVQINAGVHDQPRTETEAKHCDSFWLWLRNLFNFFSEQCGDLVEVVREVKVPEHRVVRVIHEKDTVAAQFEKLSNHRTTPGLFN